MIQEYRKIRLYHWSTETMATIVHMIELYIFFGSCEQYTTKKGLMLMNKFKLKSKPKQYEENEYSLTFLYEPQFDETEEEIHFLNYEVQTTYLGIWQGAFTTLFNLLDHVESEVVSIEFEKVWDSVELAYHNNLITWEQYEIVCDHYCYLQEEYCNKKGLPTYRAGGMK